MSLQSFTSQIAGKGVTSPNRFSAMIMPPGGSNNSVNLMVQSCEFPGQNIRTTADTLRYGPQREIGNAVMYADSTSMTFICTTGMPERTFFENWQAKVFDKTSWEVNYYSTYVGRIALNELNKRDQKGYSMFMYEAYPKTVVAQTFAQDNNNAYQTLTVEFAFRYWDSHAVSSFGGLGGLAGKFGLSAALSTATNILGAATNLASNISNITSNVNNIRNIARNIL